MKRGWTKEMEIELQRRRKYQRIRNKKYYKYDKQKYQQYRKKYKITNPFIQIFNAIKQRCENPNIKNYKYYGAKGIKNLISKQELKLLWERDNAQQMIKPTIDRIDNKQNYTFNNCRFIEHKENCRRGGLA